MLFVIIIDTSRVYSTWMVYSDRIAHNKCLGDKRYIERHACLLSVDALQNKERHVGDENRRTRSYTESVKDTLRGPACLETPL